MCSSWTLRLGILHHTDWKQHWVASPFGPELVWVALVYWDTGDTELETTPHLNTWSGGNIVHYFETGVDVAGTDAFVEAADRLFEGHTILGISSRI